MAHVSHKLSNSFEGALAGGGDPATSPLYVFGPFLKLIVVAGVAPVTFGASVWLVIITVVMVSAMYRLVMNWVTDGSGGSGLSEEEFGGWAVKVNAGITFVEYTLTFLVSMAALVTFIADRYPALNHRFLMFQYRTFVAIALSLIIAWLVNRGPKMAARAFGPATLGVLILLWAMVFATIWKYGFHLARVDFRAFNPEYLHFTFGGFARILALMTGIEIFANLVAAYQGSAREKSRKAFGSLMIIMGTTSATMLIVGPAILRLSDSSNATVSVFTQTMDQLLPAPLPYLGTLIGIIVLGSASAASAQGLQNLALGLRYRNYIPAPLGQRNHFDVADKPVWIEVAIVSLCYLAFGTHEETYLAIYAAGVFVLLSMTGWAVGKRLVRELRTQFSASGLFDLCGAVGAALLTSAATVIIFKERFYEGAWTYFVFIPLLYIVFTSFRSRLGEPNALEDHLGRVLAGQYLLPFHRTARSPSEITFENIVVPLDGSLFSEHALGLARVLGHVHKSRLTLLSVDQTASWKPRSPAARQQSELQTYLSHLAWQIKTAGLDADFTITSGPVSETINTLAHDLRADLIVMSTHGRSGVERLFVGNVASKLVKITGTPLLLIRPTEEWKSRTSQFKTLLVSLDGSQDAEQVLGQVIAIAMRFESDVLMLSVPEAEAETDRLQQYLDGVAAALRNRGINVRTIVTGSGPARTILALSESESVDLIMMATHGRGGIQRGISIGSVADRVVQSTQCPVFLVPVRKQSRLTSRSAEQYPKVSFAGDIH